jgi:hypothetical protein
MARYIPGNVPSDTALLAVFLRLEIEKIAQALDTANERYTFDTLYAAPKKYGEGTTVKADGTTWNPGSGGGTYQYRAGAWHFLG